MEHNFVKTVAFKYCDVNFVKMCTEKPLCSPREWDGGIASGDTVDISCSVNMRPDLIKPSYVQLTWFKNDSSLISIESNGTDNSGLMLPYSRKTEPGDMSEIRCSLSLSVNQASTSSYDQSSPSEEICSFPNWLVSCELLHMFLLSFIEFILICKNS